MGRGASDLKCGSEKWPGLLCGDWAVGGHEQRVPSVLWSSRWERGGQIRGDLEGECDLGLESEDPGRAWACYESEWCWEQDEVVEEKRVEVSLGAVKLGSGWE